jgi:hypothetical protein
VSFESLRALALDITFSNMGVPATVTRPAPDNTPVSTSGIWLEPEDETQPFGTDFQNRGARKVMAFARTAALANAPRGTVIAAAELAGGTVKNWRVDGYARSVTADEMRLILIETT